MYFEACSKSSVARKILSLHVETSHKIKQFSPTEYNKIKMLNTTDSEIGPSNKNSQIPSCVISASRLLERSNAHMLNKHIIMRIYQFSHFESHLDIRNFIVFFSPRR